MNGSMAVEQRRGGGSGLIWLVILAVLGGGFYLAVAAPAPKMAGKSKVVLPAAPRPGEEVIIDNYSHAWEHEKELPTVRKCLGDSGTWKQDFRTTDPGRFLRACWDGKRTISFQIIDRIGQVLKEKTAYIRHDAYNPTDVVNYIKRVGYIRVK